MSEEKNVVEKYDDLPKNAETGERFTVRDDAIVYERQEDGTWKDVDIDEAIDAQNEQESTDEQTPSDEAQQPATADENQQPAEDGQTSEDSQAAAGDNAQQGPASDAPAAAEEGSKVEQQTPANGGEQPVDAQKQTDNQNPSTESAEPVASAEQKEEAEQANPDQELPSSDTDSQSDTPSDQQSDEATPRQESAVNEVTDEKQQDGEVPPTAPAAPAVDDRPRAEVNPDAPQSTPEAKPDDVQVAAAQEQATGEDKARDQIEEAGADATPATSAEPTPAGEQKAETEAQQQAAAEQSDKPADTSETPADESATPAPNSGVADDVNDGKPHNDQTYVGDQNADNTPSPATVQHQENHTAEENPVVSQEETAVQNATDPDQPTIIPAEATSESMNHSPANPTQETVYVKQDENVDPEVKVIRQRIEEYIAQMGRNGSHRRNEGPKHQARLYQTLHAIMALEPIKFKQAMDYLLDRVYEERAGAFSDVYVRRYFDLLTPQHLQNNQVKEFDNVLSLVTNVGYSKNRSRALQQVDLQRALKNIQDAGKQQRMAAYFSALR